MIPKVRFAFFLLSNFGSRLCTDARQLFERTILNYSGAGARDLWAAWWKYEYYFTELDDTVALDKRLAEAFPEGRCS